MGIDVVTLAIANAAADEKIKQAAIGGVDLTDYLKKEEAYTRQEIDDKVENLDYENLKNKPFYSEIVTGTNRDIIPLQKMEFQDSDMSGMLVAHSQVEGIDVIEGKQYNLEIDGQTHLITMSDGATEAIGLPSGSLVFGNLGILNSMIDSNFVDTGEDYLGYFFNNDKTIDFVILYKTTATTHTIRVSFIDDIVPIIAEENILFEETDYTSFPIAFKQYYGTHYDSGEIFNVTFNNIKYRNIAAKKMGEDDEIINIVGNLSFLDSTAYEDTGENFLFFVENSLLFMLTNLPAGNYVVSLEKVLQPVTTEVVHKIDSKYLDIDVPYTENDEGDIVFENDVYINDSTSVANIEKNLRYTKDAVSNLQGEVDTLESDIITLQNEVDTINDSLANSGNGSSSDGTSKQLVEGLLGGFSTHSNAMPTGKNAWVEGKAACFRDITSLCGGFSLSTPYLSVIVTTNNKGTTTTAAIVLTPTDTIPSNIISELQGYSHLSIRFQDVPVLSYYVSITNLQPTDTTVEIEFTFVDGHATFPMDTTMTRNIQALYALPALGDYSHSEGLNTIATTQGGHAEGSNTIAKGEASHAEGAYTTARGNYSHAEGGSFHHNYIRGSQAIGDYSHSEGRGAIANGYCAHAEGEHTIANGDYSHVQGRFNIEDTENKYIHIVGNGSYEIEDNGAVISHFSNAHTLDWDGNAWYAGTVEATGIILPSTTEGSTKRFLITIDDAGTLTAAEIVE